MEFSCLLLQFFIDPAKLLPLARFLPKPPGEVAYMLQHCMTSCMQWHTCMHAHTQDTCHKRKLPRNLCVVFITMAELFWDALNAFTDLSK